MKLFKLLLHHPVLILCTAALSLSQLSDAQKLPALPDDPSVVCGVFENGIHYYLLPNDTQKGIVSMALLQKNSGKQNIDSLTTVARRRFSAPGPVVTSFEAFLSRNGMAPSEGGYVLTKPLAICYIVENVLNDNSQSVTDSLLFAMFSTARCAASEGLPSDYQAFVACGDFEVKTFLAKLRTAAQICPHVDGKAPGIVFPKAGQGRMGELRMEAGQLSRIVAEWYSPHIPARFMKTVLPFVSDKMAREFNWVLERRLYPRFRAGGYQTWMDSEYTGSSDTGSDECLKVNVGCPARQRVWVMDIMEKEFARLLTWGVGENEYTYARDSYRYEWLAASRPCIYDNRRGLQRCMSAFIFGASLATEEEKMKFAYRAMPDSVQTKLFNNFVSRMLKQTAKPDSTLEPLAEKTSRSVVAAALDRYRPESCFRESKVKVKAESVTGGKLFTFPNGLNVVWCNKDTKGFCRYAFASKGGRQWADAAGFSTIDGIFEEDFANYLSSQGITMEVHLDPVDVMLKGKAPEENMSELLMVLAALSARESNRKAFGDDCYKLLVLCTSASEEKILSLLSAYATVLGPAGEWTSCNAVGELAEDYFKYRDYRLMESVFQYDLSTGCTATSLVALRVLEREMARHFGGHGCSYLCQGRFGGFPSDMFKLHYGVHEEALSGFATGETPVQRFTFGDELRQVAEKLAGEPIPAAELSLCRKAALNRQASLSATPEYAVEAACCRYLYNRDVFSRLTQAISSVTEADIRDFFSRVTANLNYIP